MHGSRSMNSEYFATYTAGESSIFKPNILVLRNVSVHIFVLDAGLIFWNDNSEQPIRNEYLILK